MNVMSISIFRHEESKITGYESEKVYLMAWYIKQIFTPLNRT